MHVQQERNLLCKIRFVEDVAPHSAFVYIFYIGIL